VTIDAGGIEVRNPVWSVITGAGQLTSNQRFLDIHLPVKTIQGNGAPHYGLVISSVISDAPTHQVGLRVTGYRPHNAYAAVVYIQGSESNTFTGDVVVAGSSNYLALGKTNGAIAIRGNISVGQGKGGILRFDEGGQVSRNTTITLNSGTIYMSEGKQAVMETAFKSLIVEGRGAISFGSSGWHKAKRYIYLDELVIEGKGYLDVVEWAPERDYILVRKTMDKAALDAALAKIHFKGWAPGRTHLEDYNKDFWEISGLPEPAAYGAVLGAVGLACWQWRRRFKRRRRAAARSICRVL